MGGQKQEGWRGENVTKQSCEEQEEEKNRCTIMVEEEKEVDAFDQRYNLGKMG